MKHLSPLLTLSFLVLLAGCSTPHEASLDLQGFEDAAPVAPGMYGAKISQLTALDEPLVDTDEAIVNDYSASPSTRRADMSQILSYMQSGLTLDASTLDLTDDYSPTGTWDFTGGTAEFRDLFFTDDESLDIIQIGGAGGGFDKIIAAFYNSGFTVLKSNGFNLFEVDNINDRIQTSGTTRLSDLELISSLGFLTEIGNPSAGVVDIDGDVILTEATGYTQSEVDSAFATQTALDTESTTRLAADNRRAFAGGVELNGTSGYIDATVAATNPFAEGGTILFAMRPNAVSSQQRIYNSRSGSNGWMVFLNADGTLQFNVLTSGTVLANVSDAAFVSAGEYVFVAITFDGTVDSDAPIIYKNGEVIASSGATTASGTISATQPAGKIGRSNASSDSFFGGSIAQVFTFNRVLSASEIEEIYTIGIAPWLAKYPEEKWGGGLLGGTAAWTENDAFTTFTSSAYGDLDFSVSGESGAAYSGLSTHTLGKTVLVPYTLTVNSGTIPTNSRLVFVNTSGVTVGTAEDSTSSDLQAGSHVAALTFTAEAGAVDNLSRLAIKIPSGTVDVSMTFDPVVYQGCTAALPLTEGAGRVLRDLSTNRHDALLSSTGYAHVIERSDAQIRASNVDATGGVYLLEASNLLDPSTVITGVVVDGIYHAASGTQTEAYRRVRVLTSGSDVLVQRSNGTTHQTIATATPSDPTDFAITVLTSRY